MVGANMKLVWIDYATFVMSDVSMITTSFGCYQFFEKRQLLDKTSWIEAFLHNIKIKVVSLAKTYRLNKISKCQNKTCTYLQNFQRALWL
jgi:hypothetical protein